jgi:hypothetical protein
MVKLNDFKELILNLKSHHYEYPGIVRNEIEKGWLIPTLFINYLSSPSNPDSESAHPFADQSESEVSGNTHFCL